MEFNRESLKLLPLKGDNGLRALAKKKGIKMPKGKGSKDDFITAILKSQPGTKYTADTNRTRPPPPPPPMVPLTVAAAQAIADQEIKYRFAEGSAEEGLLLTRVERDLARSQLRGILDAERTFQLAETSEQLNIRKIEMGVESDLNLMTPTGMNSAMEQARDAVAKARAIRRLGEKMLYLKQDDKDATYQIGKYKVGRYSDGSRMEASSMMIDDGDALYDKKTGKRIQYPYKSFADYYRGTAEDGRMPKLERVKSNLTREAGAERLTYQETRLFNPGDVNKDAGLFEIELFGKKVVIALGESDENSAPYGPNSGYDITFWPIYIIEDETVKGRIGVYEVFTDELEDPENEYYDEDGDLDITKLEPLLFRFVDKQYIEKKEYLKFSTKKKFRDQERVFMDKIRPGFYTDDFDQDEYEDDATHIGDEY